MAKSKHTYRERLIAGLIALRYIRDDTNKSRYDAFIEDNDYEQAKKRKMFVGAYGALRCGLSASQSTSLGEPGSQTPYYKQVLALGDAALKAPTPSIQEQPVDRPLLFSSLLKRRYSTKK